jgi:hypothetical protein
MRCVRCERSFDGLHDFIEQTTPIFQSSGLMEHEDASGKFVLLMRNCLCGTSLALSCQDRRDRSQRGLRKREQFDGLVSLLVETGVAPTQARAEIRQILQDP